jgi:glycerol uptake facilitator-like aquaporin
VAGLITFIVVYAVLYIGGDPILNPASAIMSTMKGQLSRTECGFYILVQVAGFIAAFLLYKNYISHAMRN